MLRLWLAGLLACGLFVSTLRAEAHAFQSGGVYSTTLPGELPRDLPAFGSWINGDDFRGELTSPWAPVRSNLTVYVSGYPVHPGQKLTFEWRMADGSTLQTEYHGGNPMETWVAYMPAVPSGATEVRWHAVDDGTGFAQWFGVSHFKSTTWWQSDAAYPWRAQGVFLLLGAILIPAHLLIRATLEHNGGLKLVERERDALAPILTIGLVTLLSYALFWLWYASPAAGRAGTSLTAFILGVTAVLSARRATWKAEWLIPHAIATLAGCIYLALLFSPMPHSIVEAGANRFVPELPIDNAIPGMLAERLFLGKPTVPFDGNWLAGDRPPLQAAWVLWAKFLLPASREGQDLAAGIGGMWLQLSWVAASWAVFRCLGLSRKQAVYALLLILPLGFLLLNTVYVWPKLSAAALMIGAFILLLGHEPAARANHGRLLAAGALAGLALLSHAGAGFALIALIPFGLIRWRGWRSWLLFGAATALLLAPWIAYQKRVDPPSDRLLKWHLAGVIDVDPRSFPQTLVEEYRRIGWNVAIESRQSNVVMQIQGNWSRALDFSDLEQRRKDEMENFLRSAGLLLPAGLLAWLVWAKRRRLPSAINGSHAGALALWVALTWIVWLLLLFQPNNAVAFHGSYTIALTGYCLLAAALVREWPRFSLAVLAAQAAYTIAIWLPVLPGYAALLRQP